MAFVAFGSQAPTKQQGPARTGWVALFLLLPGLFYLALFFITPLVSLIITSLKQPSETGAIGNYDYGLEFGNYVYAITQYAPQIFRSFSFALFQLSSRLPLVIQSPISSR